MIKYGLKKDVHVTLPATSYVKVKIASFERQLTLQDLFAGFAALIAEDHYHATEILNDLATLKYSGELKSMIYQGKVSEVDSELIYKMLEKNANDIQND